MADRIGAARMVRWCFVHPIAFYGFHQTLSAAPRRAAHEPFVSILVPACNEAETMDAAVRSLIALDYPHYEVVVIDDGSKDDTYAIAKQHEGDYERCTVSFRDCDDAAPRVVCEGSSCTCFDGDQEVGTCDYEPDQCPSGADIQLDGDDTKAMTFFETCCGLEISGG